MNLKSAMKNNLTIGVGLVVVSLVVLAINVVTVLSAPLRSVVTVPQRIGFQGYAAYGSGVPLDGAYDILVNVYDAATGGT
jgi:hypothetical protein